MHKDQNNVIKLLEKVKTVKKNKKKSKYESDSSENSNRKVGSYNLSDNKFIK